MLDVLEAYQQAIENIVMAAAERSADRPAAAGLPDLRRAVVEASISCLAFGCRLGLDEELADLIMIQPAPADPIGGFTLGAHRRFLEGVNAALLAREEEEHEEEHEEEDEGPPAEWK